MTLTLPKNPCFFNWKSSFFYKPYFFSISFSSDYFDIADFIDSSPNIVTFLLLLYGLIVFLFPSPIFPYTSSAFIILFILSVSHFSLVFLFYNLFEELVSYIYFSSFCFFVYWYGRGVITSPSFIRFGFKFLLISM